MDYFCEQGVSFSRPKLTHYVEYFLLKMRSKHLTLGYYFIPEYVKAVYCHPAYLPIMQSTS